MVKVKELRDRQESGAEMYALVDRFNSDLDLFEHNGRPLSELPFTEFYELVKSIPYREDDPDIEIVSRPYHLFSFPWRGWDCKKKAQAIASWLERNGHEWQFTAVSSRPDGRITHCIVRAMTPNGMQDIDATYPWSQLVNRQWTRAEDLRATNDNMHGWAVYSEETPTPENWQEFADTMVQMGAIPEGALIAIKVAGIVVGAISATVAGVIGIATLVQNKRMQERAQKAQENIIAYQEDLAAKAKAYEQQEEEDQRADIKEFLTKWGVPLGVTAGLFIL